MQFLPISGLQGANMKERLKPEVCPWYEGPSFFELLDALEPPDRDPKGPVRWEGGGRWGAGGEGGGLAERDGGCLSVAIRSCILLAMWRSNLLFVFARLLVCDRHTRIPPSWVACTAQSAGQKERSRVLCSTAACRVSCFLSNVMLFANGDGGMMRDKASTTNHSTLRPAILLGCCTAVRISLNILIHH